MIFSQVLHNRPATVTGQSLTRLAMAGPRLGSVATVLALATLAASPRGEARAARANRCETRLL